MAKKQRASPRTTSIIRFVLLAECVMKTDIPEDTPVYVELDNVPGQTEGDRIVKPGDKLEPNEKVQIGKCEEW